jgi:WD40 repeat protein
VNLRRFVFPQLIILTITLLTIQAWRLQVLLPASSAFDSRLCKDPLERDLSGHTSEIFSVTFSQDGRYALTGSNDWTARLWDVRTRREIRTFKGHTGGVTSAIFSPDGKYVLTSSMDRTARLWNARSGKEVRIFEGCQWR